MKIWQLEDMEQEVQDLKSSNTFYVSFSDLMLILLVFMVMLVSISKVETGSFESIKTAFSGRTEGTLVELATTLKRIAEKDPGIPGVKVRMAKDGVRLDLESAALFDTGSAVLKEEALAPLRPI